jgi:hypothetical protein
VAPLGLLFSPEAAPFRDVVVATGLGAGATVVCGGLAAVVVRQAARILLYHFVQSVVLEVVMVDVFAAPGDLPEGV